MGENFIGEVKMVGFDFPPKDWSYCDGATIPITQNPALYSVLSDQFGGDLNTYFKLPDLRGRVPVHPDVSSGFTQGTIIGLETVTPTLAQMGKHTHELKCTITDGDSRKAIGTNIQAAAINPYNNDAPVNIYGAAADMTQLATATSETVGGGQAHNNLQPSLVITFIIALDGLYPSRN